MTRIFQSIPLTVGASIALDQKASHHLINVLRVKTRETITLFNNQGGEYASIITDISKKSVTVEIKQHLLNNKESPLKIILAQGISRGEKMDFTIQKAVELGVHKIVPLFTEFCNVKLDKERESKRLSHWQSVIISACEQSGRNLLPEITPPLTLKTWVNTREKNTAYILSPDAALQFKQCAPEASSQIEILIGPEGGFSQEEINLATTQGYQPIKLGPRILRTETAALAAISTLQSLYGDLG